MKESSDEERGHAMKVSGAISYSKFRIYVNVIVFKFIAYLPFVADEVPEPAWRQDRSARHQGKRMWKKERVVPRGNVAKALQIAFVNNLQLGMNKVLTISNRGWTNE